MKTEQENIVSERDPIHGRFSGASWYNHPVTAIVGGAGGIGSWLTLFLARQGHDIHVFDFDTVEEHNIGGQIYELTQVGSAKVDALNTICQQLANCPISVYNERYDENSMSGPYLFSCFDNMEARMAMFRNWALISQEANWEGEWLFIDGRLNAETAEFFCVHNRETADKWLKTWFPDSKVEDAPCTYKATSHCAAILAGMMTGALNNFVANMQEGEQREVPFRTSIWLPTMTVISEN